MSFILDALKKSEADRQRRSDPENAYVAAGSDNRKSSRWVWIFGVLLALNSIVLAYVILKPEPAVVSELDTPIAADEAAGMASFKEIVAEAKRSTVAQNNEAPTSVAAATDTLQTAQEDKSANNTATVPSTKTTAYQTLNDVRVAGNAQLPDLHLDIHVYSAIANDRFVFVNMIKYKEQSTLNEGPFVREIVPEGVILEYQGLPFLLPRE